MELSKQTRITLIIVAGVVIVALAIVSMLSGSTIDFAEIVGALGGGVIGLLSGVGWAGGRARGRAEDEDRQTFPDFEVPSPPTVDLDELNTEAPMHPVKPPSGPGLVGFCLSLILTSTSCASIPSMSHSQQPEPWDQARMAMGYVRASVGAIVAIVPGEAIQAEQNARCGDLEECRPLPELLSEVIGEIDDEIGRWEDRGGDSRSWVGWLGQALRWTRMLIDAAEEHGADVPGWVSMSIEGASAILLGLAGEAPPNSCPISPGQKSGCDQSWVWAWSEEL